MDCHEVREGRLQPLARLRAAIRRRGLLDLDAPEGPLAEELAAWVEAASCLLYTSDAADE